MAFLARVSQEHLETSPAAEEVAFVVMRVRLREKLASALFHRRWGDLPGIVDSTVATNVDYLERAMRLCLHDYLFVAATRGDADAIDGLAFFWRNDTAGKRSVFRGCAYADQIELAMYLISSGHATNQEIADLTVYVGTCYDQYDASGIARALLREHRMSPDHLVAWGGAAAGPRLLPWVHAAIGRMHPEVVEVLLEHGASFEGYSALFVSGAAAKLQNLLGRYGGYGWPAQEPAPLLYQTLVYARRHLDELPIANLSRLPHDLAKRLADMIPE